MSNRPRQHRRGSKKWRGHAKHFISDAVHVFNVVFAAADSPVRLVSKVPTNPRWQRKDTTQ